MIRILPALALALALSVTTAASAQTSTEWDGLARVPSTHFDAAFVAPGASFSTFTKVMIDPTEAAFRRNWLRDFNNSQARLSSRISNQQAEQMLEAMRTGFNDVFVEAYTAGGYQVVTTPGPDVLRVRTAIVNVDISAPDTRSPGRSRTFSRDAGAATLIVEVRDSMSGALLARGVDGRAVGDNAFMMPRSSVSNRADFRRVFQNWARMSVQGLDQLRAMPEAAPPAATGSP